jgi:hypothetical protein
MKKSCSFFEVSGISRYLILAALMAAFLCCSPACASPAQDMPGTWNVVAQLVAATTEDPNDPYAPKPGMIKPDTWTIYNGDAGPVLSSSIGSIAGQYTDRGSIFEGTYPLGSGVYVAIKIECFMDGSSSMYGTNENDYWGTNTVTGEIIKRGIESWMFRATKQ